MAFAGKSMELEISMLGDINQTQKGNYHMCLSYAASRLKKQSRENKTKQKD